MRKYNRSYMRPATQGREISKFEVLTTKQARTENISFLCRAKFSQSRVKRAARLFSSINQWCHCFVALGLSSTSSSVSRTGKIKDKLVSSEATQEVWDLLVQDRGIFLTPTERAVLYCNCRWWHCNKKKTNKTNKTKTEGKPAYKRRYSMFLLTRAVKLLPSRGHQTHGWQVWLYNYSPMDKSLAFGSTFPIWNLFLLPNLELESTE